jgi:16S rRNA (guanine1207-N2)-methyltransferase
MARHPKADPGGLARANLADGGATWLVAEVPDLETAGHFDPDQDPRFIWFSTHWPTWDALVTSGRTVLAFGLWIPAQWEASVESGGHPGEQGSVPEGATLFMQKSRDRLRMTLAGLSALLPVGGRIQIAGTKDEGIQSAGRVLEDFATLSDPVSGKHARIVLGRTRVRAGSGTVQMSSFLTPWDARVGNEPPIPLHSFPGVFSHGTLDQGTQLLLETVPVLPGPVLDVGCGAGIVGIWYHLRGAGAVTFVDADAAAVEATRASIARLGSNVDPTLLTVVAGDGLPGPRPFTPRFQSIVSNPPFHQGVQTNHRVTASLIAEAPGLLLPGGTLTLVCNRFLPILDPLDRAFGGHRILADDGRYRVVQAVRSR